jgi:hypothetical protein
VDWSYLRPGPREVDLAYWLPSLQVEGGPSPEEAIALYESYWGRKLSRDKVLLSVAHVAGYFGFHCQQPAVPELPKLRDLQKRQFVPAYAWLKRELSQIQKK